MMPISKALGPLSMYNSESATYLITRRQRDSFPEMACMLRRFCNKRLRLTARILCCAVCVAFCLAPATATACKYSVRDVGFVDLSSQPYRLYCFLNGESHGDFAAEFLKTAKSRFADSNVVAEVVDVVANPDHPALKYRPTTTAIDAPELVLIAPESDLPPLPLDVPVATMGNELTRLVASPLRDQIWNSIVEAYAVVVVIEGESPEENRRAADAGRFAIKQLNGIMAQMDKPVDTPPKLLIVSAEQAAREPVLLWSWGLSAEDRKEPAVVTLFGRGRQLGPVVAGSDISGTELFETLALVGKSCECELDRSWMQGPMFPHAWDINRQADVTRALGFDAENPLIKVEISRIIARGDQNRSAKDAVDAIAIDPLLGYGEFDVDTVSIDESPLEETPLDESSTDSVSPVEETVETPSTAEVPTAVVDAKPNPITATESPVAQPEETSSLATRDTAVITTVLLCIVAIGGGLFLLYRRQGQA